jgi:hypothetical protein
MTYDLSPNATSSQALAAGPSPCAWPDGTTTLDLFGPAPAHANLSARQAKERGFLTSGTCGRPSTTSSNSAALQASLASRLQAATASTGSTLYALTWKDRATPSGLRICALRASVRRTSDSDSSGWPTPTTPSGGRSVSIDKMDATGRTADGKKHTASLEHAVKFAGWPTPMAGTPAQNGNNAAGNNDSSRKTVDVVSWHLAGWPTPLVGGTSPASHGQISGDFRRAMDAALKGITQPARLTVSGELLTGSDAGMESGGQLNPAHSRWLMGYPPEWDDCGVTAMPSSRKSRQLS